MPKYIPFVGRHRRSRPPVFLSVEALDARALTSGLAPEGPPPEEPPCVAELLPPPSPTLFFD
jgi:hypothetical protein